VRAIDFRTCEALSPRLNTIFATRALLGDDAIATLPPATTLVGPSIPPEPRGDEPDDFPWHRLDETERPILYVSFGSQIWRQPERFTAIARAAAEGWQAVLAAGELAHDPTFIGGLAGAPIVVRYAPQRAILSRATAFLTHGGANSVMESLVAGVPMIVTPICNDQPVQAHYVTRAGAGIAIHDELTVDNARAALRTISSHAPRAKEIAADYARHDGAREVARRIVAS
jgi:UDP:flavonoid glycosyltransferase YjiC (YdhE family)